MRIYILFIFCTVVLISCDKGINDKRKRNEHWAWYENGVSGKGKWIPVGESDNTNLINGKVTFFYCNGSISEVQKVKDGTPYDTSFEYDINGLLEGYIFEGGKYAIEGDTLRYYYLHDGPYIRYYDNGDVYAKGIIKNHEAGDEWTEYYHNSNIEFSYTLYENSGDYSGGFENGNIEFIQDGEFIHLHNSHKLKLINGIMMDYYENVGRKDSVEIIDGKMEGEFTGFYENHKLRCVYNMKDGKIDGRYKKYDSSGRYIDEIMFKDGEKIK